MSNSFDIFSNNLGGNLKPVGMPYSIQSRNNFASQFSSFMPNKDPMTAAVTKAMDLTGNLVNNSKNLLQNLNNNFSNLLNALKRKIGGASTGIEAQTSREINLKKANHLDKMQSFFTRSLDGIKGLERKLGALDFLKNLKPNMSTETMIVLAILLLKQLGLNNLKGLVTGLNGALLALKNFRLGGLAFLGDLKKYGLGFLKGFKDGGLNFLRGLKDRGVFYLNAFKAKGLEYLDVLKKKGISTLESLKSKGLKALETLKLKGLNYLNDFKIKAISKLDSFRIKGLDHLKGFKLGALDHLSGFKFKGLAFLSNLKTGSIKVFENFAKVGGGIFTSLKSGFEGTFRSLKSLTGFFGKLVMMIPGVKGLVTAGKTIAKALPGIGLAFNAYDAYQGYNNAAEISGDKNPTFAQKLKSAGINVATGQINAYSDLAHLGGYGLNTGTLSSKGVYEGLSGKSREEITTNVYNPRSIATNGLGTPVNADKQPINLDGSPAPNNKTGSGFSGGKRGGKPVDRMVITSYPGGRDKPNAKASSDHRGTDIGVPVGTKVFATHAGKVSIYNQGAKEGYGLYVVISAGGFYTLYAHLSQVMVNNGQMVQEGDLIALSGNSGNSTGAHLHYEYIKNGQVMIPFTGTNAVTPGGGKKQQTAYSGSGGGNASASRRDQTVSVSSGLSQPNIMDKAFKAIAINEGATANPAGLAKDNVGYTFGLSQFNSSTNSEAWKELGFTSKELQAINSGNFDRNAVQAKLNNSKNKISSMDQQNKKDLYSWALNFGKIHNIDISNPIVFANMMDIGNQFNKGDINAETAQKLIKFSGSRKITPEGVLAWRKQTLHEKTYKGDMERRFKNITKVVGTSALAAVTGFSSVPKNYIQNSPVEKVKSVRYVTKPNNKNAAVAPGNNASPAIINNPVLAAAVNAGFPLNNGLSTLNDPFNVSLNSTLSPVESVNPVKSNMEGFSKALQGVQLNKNLFEALVSGDLSKAGNAGLELINKSNDIFGADLSNKVPVNLMEATKLVVNSKNTLSTTGSLLNSAMNGGDLASIGVSLYKQLPELNNLGKNVFDSLTGKNNVLPSELEINREILDPMKKAVKEEGKNNPVFMQMPANNNNGDTGLIDNNSDINDNYLISTIMGVFD